jgi:hypothetical protein
VVYASPGTIDAYRKDGRFPDGAVLVKEVFDTSRAVGARLSKPARTFMTAFGESCRRRFYDRYPKPGAY